MTDSVFPVPRTNTDPTELLTNAVFSKLLRDAQPIYDDAGLSAWALLATETIDALRVELAAVTEQRDKLRKHSQTHRGEMSGYTVGEVEFVESRLRAAEAQLAAVTTEVDWQRKKAALAQQNAAYNGESPVDRAYANGMIGVLNAVAAAMRGKPE